MGEKAQKKKAFWSGARFAEPLMEDLSCEGVIRQKAFTPAHDDFIGGSAYLACSGSLRRLRCERTNNYPQMLTFLWLGLKSHLGKNKKQTHKATQVPFVQINVLASSTLLPNGLICTVEGRDKSSFI